MVLKNNILKEGLGYKGSKFEENLTLSGAVKEFNKLIEEQGLVGSYFLMLEKYGDKITNFLSENIESVVVFGNNPSRLLFEGYASKSESEKVNDLNEGLQDALASFVLRVVGQKKVLSEVGKILEKNKITSYDQAVPVIRKTSAIAKLPLEKMKRNIELSRGIADGTKDYRKVASMIQQEIQDEKPGLSGIIDRMKQKKVSAKAEKVYESFIKEGNKLLTELSFLPVGVGNFLKNKEAAKEHGGYQHWDEKDVDPNVLAKVKQDAAISANTSQVGDAAHASQNIAKAITTTITSFVAQIPLLGPVIAPFAPFVAAMLVPIIIGLIFRRKK